MKIVAGAAALLATVAIAAPATADWSRGYAIAWYEPAMYFGRDDASVDAPGTDCPNGTNPPVDWVSLLIEGGMDPAEAEKYRDPDFRTAGNSLYSLMPVRGPGGVNVYDHPEAIPDPGVYTVQGDIAYGLNLDGDATTGFTSPTGERGVDNAFYRASGCIIRFRGAPKKASSFMYSMEDMHNGAYTVVFLLSGPGDDPMNDPDARMGVYLAKDKLVRSSDGGVDQDYSYRIDPQPAFQTVLDIKVTDGVVETRGAQRITMRDFWAPGFFPRELVLEQGQVRFEMQPDGKLVGMIAGYRDWREHYRGNAGNGRDGSGAIHENLGRFQLPAWWQALKRNADGMPDPVTGEMRGISTVYHIDAVPAFVTTPDASENVTVARIFEPEAREQAAVGAATRR